ncbi:MAG TPA: DNA gyrase subunit A, partial [Thermoanaerobaculia bacterium]|nr:DNA gyrase subunit A [Thermoanaerobaculia bacterium]
GSLDGDNPAAMRYTEVRLTRLAEEMIKDDIDKETVDWVPNYDGSEQEPTVLPARVPNLLVNGASGIAVGMATNIPPHNLGEVVDALDKMLDNPDVTVDELLQVLPGPDFPTAGFIHGVDGIRTAYTTGRGMIQLRARAEIEERGERQAIVVTEIPYQVNKARLLERMGELIREKKIEGISDLRDESDRAGIRIVLEVKRGEVGEVILNQLYKMTQLQMSFGIILLAIVDNRPRVMNLHELLRHFLDHRRTVVVRRSRYDLKKAEERAHILEGLLKALDVLDRVIATIRASHTPEQAREALMARFEFSEIQTRAILDMRLQRLTGLEREKLQEEYGEVMATIERLRALLASDQLVDQEIRRELAEIKDAYGDKRRTEIIAAAADISIEDMIADEPMVITVTRAGYVKRSPLSLYRAQRRGGKGRMGMATKEEDTVEHLYVATAHSYILVFTQSGRAYWLKVHAIPEFGPAARGKAIVNLLDLGPEERFATTVAVREFPEDRYLTFITERGTIKRTSLAAFARPQARGIIAVNVIEGDRLLDVKVAEEGSEIFLATARGYALRFEAADVRSMGRTATGVRGISLRKGDRLVGMEVLAGDGAILSVTENGFGKRSALAEYRLQGRGGLGILNFAVNAKTGEVVGFKQVEPGMGVMLITQDGMIIRTRVDEASFRVIGRATQGVKVMDLESGDRLVALAKLEDDDEAGANGADDEGEASEESGEAEGLGDDELVH